MLDAARCLLFVAACWMPLGRTAALYVLARNYQMLYQEHTGWIFYIPKLQGFLFNVHVDEIG